MPLLESHTQEGLVLRWGRGAERSRSWRQDAVLTHVDTPAHACTRHADSKSLRAVSNVRNFTNTDVTNRQETSLTGELTI